MIYWPNPYYTIDTWSPTDFIKLLILFQRRLDFEWANRVDR